MSNMSLRHMLAYLNYNINRLINKMTNRSFFRKTHHVHLDLHNDIDETEYRVTSSAVS